MSDTAKFDYNDEIANGSSTINKETMMAGMKWDAQRYQAFQEDAALELLRREIWVMDNMKKEQLRTYVLLIALLRIALVDSGAPTFPEACQTARGTMPLTNTSMA